MRPQRKSLAPLAAAALVIVMGVLGWRAVGDDYPDSIYKALQAFALGDVYSDLASRGEARWLLELVRWLGSSLAFYTVLLLLWSSLADWRLERIARRWKDHVLVLGDGGFADRLSEVASGEELKSRVIQLGSTYQVPFRRGRLIRLPFQGFHHNGFEDAGAARARRLLIAATDDSVGIDTALAAQRRYPELTILARVSDSRLSHCLHDLPGGETLRTFSETEAAAREVVRRHPLFLLAEDQNQNEIRALVIGDDVAVESLLVEIILSSLTGRFRKLKFTLAVTDPGAFRRRLEARYPELAFNAEVRFTALDPVTIVSDEHLPGEETTAAYVTFSDCTRSLASALSLKSRARACTGSSAPIFTRTSSEQGIARPLAGAKLRSLEIAPFGTITDVIRAAGILSETADNAEKAWHDAYLRFSADSEAATPWRLLSEEYRLSNRRAVAHTYAKLYEAGFDLRAWLPTAKPWDELPALQTGEHLFRDEAELRRLATLEHERWSADRRLLGWIKGSAKDTSRKVHPDLVDFDDLPVEIQSYDLELVRNLNAILPRRQDGLERLPSAF